MARSRTQNKEFPASPSVGRISIPARLAFKELWNIADDEGRFRYIPSRLQAAIYPYDDWMTPQYFRGLLDEMAKEDMIRFYTVGEREYIHVVNLLKYQTINRPSPSRHPAPPYLNATVLPTIHGVLTEDSDDEEEELDTPHGGLIEHLIVGVVGEEEEDINIRNTPTTSSPTCQTSQESSDSNTISLTDQKKEEKNLAQAPSSEGELTSETDQALMTAPKLAQGLSPGQIDDLVQRWAIRITSVNKYWRSSLDKSSWNILANEILLAAPSLLAIEDDLNEFINLNQGSLRSAGTKDPIIDLNRFFLKRIRIWKEDKEKRQQGSWTMPESQVGGRAVAPADERQQGSWPMPESHVAGRAVVLADEQPYEGKPKERKMPLRPEILEILKEASNG